MSAPEHTVSGARRFACGILIAAGLFVLYFLRMGSYPLVDPDEPVYGQVAKEMAAGAGWLTPHYGGQMWFDKPPLFYWLSGVSASALGPSELASRLPSAVLAVGLVFLVYALAAHDFGKRAGAFAALAIATCLQVIVLARAAVTDITFVFCLIAALYGYRMWFGAEGRGRLNWAALCGVMTGLAMLAKGPAGPVLLAVTFGVHLAWTKRLRRLATADAALAVVVALAVGLPWYVAMYLMHREKFVEGFLVANNLTRFLKAEHVAQTGGWYSYFVNIPILAVFFFPWSMFLPQAMRRNWRENDGARLAFCWCAVVFVFFSLSKTILVTYIFPLYPAAAVFVGALWSAAASNDAGAVRSVRRGAWALAVFSVLLGAALVIVPAEKYPGIGTAAAVLGAIAAAMGILSVLAARNGAKVSRVAWAIGAGMVVFAGWLMVGVMPVVADRVSRKALVERLPSVSGRKLVEYHLEKPSILFYTGVRPERIADPVRLEEIVRSEPRVVVFCKEANASSMEALGLRRVAESGGLTAYAGERR